MNDEYFIEERVGKRNPFLVPDGYFDHLPEQVMASLPVRKRQAKSIWLRPIYYAAACACVLLIGTGIWMALPTDSFQSSTQVMAAQNPLDVAFDEAADYMMLDNHDIYAYLAEDY